MSHEKKAGRHGEYAKHLRNTSRGKRGAAKVGRVAAKAAVTSGYTECACRDCFEIAVSRNVNNPDFCHECEEAGCERDAECARPDAYGVEEES